MVVGFYESPERFPGSGDSDTMSPTYLMPFIITIIVYIVNIYSRPIPFNNGYWV